MPRQQTRWKFIMEVAKPYLTTGRSVLDAGCGNALHFYNPLQSNGRGFPNLTLLDIDRWAHPNFVQGDVLALPFRNRAFDCVISCEVLEHLPDPATGMKEMLRVCRGVLVGTTPNHTRMPNIDDDIHVHTPEEREKYRENSWSVYCNCTGEFPNDVRPHFYHIQKMTQEVMGKMMKGCDKPYALLDLDDSTTKHVAYWGFVVRA